MVNRADLTLTSSHYLGALTRHAARLGLGRQEFFAGLDIPSEALSSDKERVDNHIVSTLMDRLLKHTDDESLSFIPEPLRPGTFALLCEHMIPARTLGEFLRRGERICDFVLGDHLGFKFDQGRDRASLYTACYVGPHDPERFLSEFWSLVWHRLSCWAIDERIELRHAQFAYPAPAHAELYEQLFQSEVNFHQPCTLLEFDQRYLRRPIVRSSQEMVEFTNTAPRNFFSLPSKNTSIRSRVTAVLREHQANGCPFPSFDAICARLNSSPPTVRSRLREEGTSYQKLKDRIRRDAAIDLLANSELSIASIAESVGFAEPAALSRAFKKWTNMSPAEYRSQF